MTAEEKYPLLIGHAIDSNKRLHNIQQVASFICKHGQYDDVAITFEDGTPFLDTFGIYINKIADMDYREELLKILIPMQMQLENAVFGDDADEQESTPKEPIKVKNLADFKRLIKPGAELMATYHGKHPEIVGLVRVVTEVQSNAFYSVIKDQPDHRYSTCNYGKGFRTDFEKAGLYCFDGSTIQVLDPRRNDGSVLYEIEVYGGENSMTEQNKEESDMNEWDRLHRQAVCIVRVFTPEAHK